MRRACGILLPALVTGLVLTLIPRSVPGAAEGGTIIGSVRFSGDPPEPKKLPVDKDNDVCGTGFRKLVEVNVGPDSRLRDLVVCMQSSAGDVQPEIPDGGFKLDQRNCRFVPDIFIVPAGQKLKITNRDPIIHNIHTYEIIKGVRRDMFNFPQPERGHRRVETIKPRRSNTVELTCDIHSFMHGWIYVSDGSRCVVSRDGLFKFTQVPDGTHTVIVWHPTLGERRVEVTVNDAQEATAEIEFSATN
ncbi:MAG: hypothetical protein ACE5HU_08170 [Acidobacteriota bacterium]